MSTEQRVVYDADQYLGHVMLDGHHTTFCNVGLEEAAVWPKALEALGASRELELLKEALELWTVNGCPGHFEANETTDAIDAIDHRFFDAMRADNNLEARTKKYVFEHRECFINLE
jgi:hypothetical protein